MIASKIFSYQWFIFFVLFSFVNLLFGFYFIDVLFPTIIGSDLCVGPKWFFPLYARLVTCFYIVYVYIYVLCKPILREYFEESDINLLMVGNFGFLFSYILYILSVIFVFYQISVDNLSCISFGQRNIFFVTFPVCVQSVMACSIVGLLFSNVREQNQRRPVQRIQRNRIELTDFGQGNLANV